MSSVTYLSSTVRRCVTSD